MESKEDVQSVLPSPPVRIRRLDSTARRWVVPLVPEPFADKAQDIVKVMGEQFTGEPIVSRVLKGRAFSDAERLRYGYHLTDLMLRLMDRFQHKHFGTDLAFLSRQLDAYFSNWSRDQILYVLNMQL